MNENFEDIIEKKEEKKKKPEFNICQPEKTPEGKTNWNSVGAIWKNLSKNGKEYYILKIGNLKLTAFKNDTQ